MMKKAATFILTAILLFALCVPALAAEGTAITSLDELEALSGKSGNFYLARDISVSKSAGAISPISGFRGKLDGNGKKIINLTVKADDTDTNIGLFDNIVGTVKNLTLENVTVELTTDAESKYFYVGAFAGENNGKIENCRVSGEVTVNAPKSTVYAGGIVGYSIKNLIYLENNAEISVTAKAAYVGGITGHYAHSGGTSLTLCVNNGSVSAIGLKSDSYGGGIAGRSECAIQNCANYGNVFVKSDIDAYSGGIVGSISGNNVTKCFSAGKITQESGRESFWDAIVGDQKCWGKAMGCYYLSGSVSGKSDSAVVTATKLSTDEAANRESFATFDSDIWKMSDGKLTLQNLTAAAPKVPTPLSSETTSSGSSTTSSSTSSSGTASSSSEGSVSGNVSGSESGSEYIPPVNGNDSSEGSNADSSTGGDNFGDFTPKKALPVWIFIVIAVLAAAGVCVFLYTYKKKN